MSMAIERIDRKNYSRFSSLIPVSITEMNLAYGSIYDEKAAGVIVIRKSNDRIYVEYLYVCEEYRKKGIANSLLRAVEEDFKKDIIIAFYKSNSDMLDFMNHIDYTPEDVYDIYHIDISSVINGSNRIVNMKKPDDIPVIKISDMDKFARVHLEKCIRNLGLTDVIDDNEINEKYSFFYENKNSVSVLLCISRDNQLTVRSLADSVRDEKAILMLCLALREEVVNKGEYDELRIMAVEKRIPILLKYLMGDAVQMSDKFIMARL